MASENPTGAFEKKVLIALESTMSGVQDTLRALESMKKHLGHTEASTKSVDKATAALSKTYSKASKDVAKLGGKFKSLKKIQKGMFEIMRSIGKVTRTALGTATVAAGAFIAETKRIGDTMLQFQVSSLNAAKSLETLGDAYGSLKSQSSSAILSMQDVAAELTKFQRQGIAQMSATMKKGFVSGWADIQGVITAVVGKTNASEIMNEWIGSLGDEFKHLRKTIAQDLGPVAKSIREAVDPDVKAQHIDVAIKQLNDLRVRTGDLGGVTQQLIGHMDTLKGVALEYASPLITGTVAINNAMTKIGTTLENVSTRLVAIFGPEIQTVVRGLGDWIEKNVTKAIDKLISKAKELYVRFQAWGGTEKLLQSLTRALDFVWQTLSKIVSVGASFIGWISDANSATKMLAGSVAAIVLAPGLLIGVAALAKGLGMVAMQGAAAAAAAKGLGGFGAAKGIAAGLVGKAAGVGLVGGAATLGHLGGKEIGGYAGLEEGGLGEALAGAAGAAATGAMIGSVIPGIGTAVGAAIGGVGSLVVSAIGAWGDDTEKAMKKSPKISDAVTRKMEQLQQKIDQLESENVKRLFEETERVAEAATAAEDKFADFIASLKDLEKYANRTLPGFTGAMSGLSAIIDVLGPQTELLGENISKLIDRSSSDQMAHGFKVLQETAAKAASELEALKIAQLAGDVEGIEQHTIMLAKAMATAEKATGALKQALEASLKPLEKQVELISAIKDLRQLDLDISQQLYGTPALAVQAQLEIVKTMQMEKEALESQLSTVQKIIAEQKSRNLSEKEIFFLRMKELDISKKIKTVTRDQLRQVKELRDGYLDAVQAQALGAGRFSKIIITQEQNLAQGLLKGAVKPNFLLGQAGADASKSRADPYRYSAQGMGFLETLGGQVMQPEDISKAVYDRVSNISDPLSRSAALQSADIFMNIMGGANKNTKDLGNIFMLGQDRVVDAINALGEHRLPRAAAGLALKGTAAGETFFGSAMDRRGLPTDAAAYRLQANRRGASQHSIQALLDHQISRQPDSGPISSGPGPVKSDTKILDILSEKKRDLRARQLKDIDSELEKLTRKSEVEKRQYPQQERYLETTDTPTQRRLRTLSQARDPKETALNDISKQLKDSDDPRDRLRSERLKLDNILRGELNPWQREEQGEARREIQRLIDVLDKRRATTVGGYKTPNERRVQDLKAEKSEIMLKALNDFISDKEKYLTPPSSTPQAKVPPQAKSGARYKVSSGSKAHPNLAGIEQILTAVDTDEFTGRGRDPKELPDTSATGKRGSAMSAGKVLSKAIWRLSSFSRLERQLREIMRKKQTEKDRIEEEQRRQRAAAEAALGLGYTGDAPERVPLPRSGPVDPGTVRGGKQSIRERVGVGDPTRIRRLTHGGGDWQNKGRDAKQKLGEAGSIIVEMGQELDRLSENEDNITEYKGNRLFDVQALSPSP